MGLSIFSCSPLIRVCLVRVADREHLLSVTMHHIVSDGWSMEVLFRELMQLYEAHIGGRASPLGECRSSTRIMRNGNGNGCWAKR